MAGVKAALFGLAAAGGGPGMTTLGKSFQLLGLSISTALVEPIMKFSFWLQDAAKWISELPAPVKSAVGNLVLWGGALSAGAWVITRTVSFFGGLLSTGAALITGIAGMASALVSGGSVAGAWSAMLRGLAGTQALTGAEMTAFATQTGVATAALVAFTEATLAATAAQGGAGPAAVVAQLGHKAGGTGKALAETTAAAGVASRGLLGLLGPLAAVTGIAALTTAAFSKPPEQSWGKWLITPREKFGFGEPEKGKLPEDKGLWDAFWHGFRKTITLGFYEEPTLTPQETALARLEKAAAPGRERRSQLQTLRGLVAFPREMAAQSLDISRVRETYQQAGLSRDQIDMEILKMERLQWEEMQKSNAIQKMIHEALK
jgi:hypothetical protein